MSHGIDKLEQSDSDQNFASWIAITESSRYRWVEDEIYHLNGRGAMYYKGGEEGIYMCIRKDGTIEAGRYEDAFPHIGDATFTPLVSKSYESYAKAYQAALEATGVPFLVDMFSSTRHQQFLRATSEDKPSLKETLRLGREKSREQFGAPTQEQNKDKGDPIL